MLCIAVVNSKGGVGKTTLCAALAVRAAKDGKRVVLVDLDPQQSLAEWFNLRGGAGSSNPEIMAGLIPVKPSSLDVLGTVEAVELARQAGVRHFAVLNDCDGNLARDAREALGACKVPVATTEIGHRLAHIHAMGHGKTAAELGAKGAAAADEIDQLWGEVVKAAAKTLRSRAKGRR
jgi:chromosome partitioning protein